jgi:hypothetical protein
VRRREFVGLVISGAIVRGLHGAAPLDVAKQIVKEQLEKGHRNIQMFCTALAPDQFKATSRNKVEEPSSAVFCRAFGEC